LGSQPLPTGKGRVRIGRSTKEFWDNPCGGLRLYSSRGRKRGEGKGKAGGEGDKKNLNGNSRRAIDDDGRGEAGGGEARK